MNSVNSGDNINIIKHAVKQPVDCCHGQCQAKVFILALSKVVSIDALCIYSGFTVFIGGDLVSIF